MRKPNRSKLNPIIERCDPVFWVNALISKIYKRGVGYERSRKI